MSSIQLDAILMIILFVATSGFAMSQLFEHLERPYLVTVIGSRARLLSARIGILSVAILVSLVVWSMLFMVLPGVAALAIFFGFEAIILDICTQRIRFERLPEVALSPAIPVGRQTASGAF